MIIDKNINHSFDELKSYDEESMIDFINDYFSEEEKINILRNEEFIYYISPELLTLMLNNMNLISVFNMLQNKNLYNKVNNINVKLTAKDSMFLKDYLSNSEFINKINHTMLKNMLINVSKDDAIDFLLEPYIKIKLTIDDIINIALLKEIDLLNDINIIDKLSKEQIIYYINEFWKNKTNYSIVDNNYVKKMLFNYTDINLEEVIYLSEYLNTKSNQNIEDTRIDLSSFKACVAIHEIFGLKRSLDIISTNKLGINEVKDLFKEVDISKTINKDNLQTFIILNIKDYLDNKYNNLVLNFGTIINNFEDEYISMSIKEIENNILNKYNINRNIKNLNKIINNDFNSNIKGIVNKINSKYEKMMNTPDIYNIKGDNYETISNKDEIMLSLDNEISNNNFIIKSNNNFITCKIINDRIYLDCSDEINSSVINSIANSLIKLNNINYIILDSNRKDIKGIRLSSDSQNDNIVILKNKAIPSATFKNDEEKSKSI